MSVWIFLGSAGEGNDDFELLESVPMVEGIVGTDASCELRLRDPMLTPRHARVLTRDGVWYVGGIAAAAATRINGVATLPGQAVGLATGDVVEMGTARFRFGAEPPQRQGVDANDEVAASRFGDRLVELGSPAGEQILEGCESAIDEGRAVPEWTRGLLTSLTLREFSLVLLEQILADESAAALERLTIAIATCAQGSQQDTVRALLQVIAKTRPPRLRRLELGWVHQRMDHPGVARDWQAVAKRVPIEGSLHDAYRLAGTPRFTMLRSGPGWPEPGTMTVLPSSGHQAFGAEWENDHRRLGSHFSKAAGSSVQFSFRSSKEDEGFTINDAWSESTWRKLIHGDLVEGEHFAFRFEESA